MNNLFQRIRYRNHRASYIRSLAGLLYRALLPALAILVLVTDGVSAASKSQTIDPPNCDAQPICGYLKAHNYQDMSSLPECGSQPICGYLIAHSGDNMLASQPPLAVAQVSWDQPAAYDPQLVVTRIALVYDGPGSSYFSYGDLPVGFVSQLIGASSDKAWWVISMPTTVAPDGMGWIDASYVQTKNLTAASAAVPNCSALPQCGYILAHSTQNLAVLQPSFFARTFGEPIIAVTGK